LDSSDEPVNKRLFPESQFLASIAEGFLDLRRFGKVLRCAFIVVLVAQHPSLQDKVRLACFIRLERGVQP
jgi:hypothetical protein